MRCPDWMDPADLRILDFLSQHDEKAAPETIADSLQYRESYIVERCGVLAKHGLIQPEGRLDPTYQMRNLGTLFLEGKVAVVDLEERRSTA